MEKRGFMEYDNMSYDPDGMGPVPISEETKKSFLMKSINSGLSLDEKNKVYFRENFGAIVAVSPAECQTVADFINWGPGKDPVFMRIFDSIKGFLKWGEFSFDNFDYRPFKYMQKYLEDGYDFVLGPGASIDGIDYAKLIYCKNYIEMLERNSKLEDGDVPKQL